MFGRTSDQDSVTLGFYEKRLKMKKKIMAYVLLNVLTFIHFGLIAQNITMAEPFSNEGPAYVDLHRKQAEVLKPLVIVGGLVPEYDMTYQNRTTENFRSEYRVSSYMGGGATIQFQNSSALFAELGAFYNELATNEISEPESSVMMRGPGGNPGGVVDDPIGSEHVLLLFVSMYGVYIYRKLQKRRNATSA